MYGSSPARVDLRVILHNKIRFFSFFDPTSKNTHILYQVRILQQHSGVDVDVLSAESFHSAQSSY